MTKGFTHWNTESDFTFSACFCNISGGLISCISSSLTMWQVQKKYLCGTSWNQLLSLFRMQLF